MSDPKNYTVGWMCAISTESIAARIFLDDRHEGPEYVAPNDSNDYTLGRIGRHNVVIAVLPHGEYGISSAAGVVKDMLHSFPNIRIGLMVGIGGGAPSAKHDIRLGDVVVSSSSNSNRHGAVFQYDFGKAIQGKEFLTTGFLNQPSPALRAAVHGLLTQYEVEGHRLDASINEVLKKNPRLKNRFERPAAETDRLYRSEKIHSSEELDCATACGDDRLIARRGRLEFENNPAVHHGAIASANRLMKDALTRDALAAQGVLCFEMEAAGIVNHFPFLVVRGICDYSDSHKNKAWQGYAAMTATAYAKDLLYRIVPSQIEAEKRIIDALTDIRAEVSTTSRKTDTLLDHSQAQERDKILQWLTPVNYGPQQSDNLRRRQEGTGQWLIDRTEFRNWRDGQNQTLFCPGMPGAGKTVLTSIVVEHLESLIRRDNGIGIAYIYCNFRRQDEQTAQRLLESILKQLARSMPTVPEAVKLLYNEHHEKGTRPSLRNISTALQSTAKLHPRTFILIDALDECEVLDGAREMLLGEIFKAQDNSSANIFVTSRSIPNIEEYFVKRNSILLEVRAADDDVRKYLIGHDSTLPSFVRNNEDLRREVTEKIVQSVDGMFLLAQLHVKSLALKTSIQAVHDATSNLRNASDPYDSAYKAVINRIKEQPKEHQDLAKQALSWIVFAKRELSPTELRHALAIKNDATTLNEDDLPAIDILIATCVGLVTVDKNDNVIKLVHYTAQQYFGKNQDLLVPKAENKLAEACATYLSFDQFEAGISFSEECFEKMLQSNPFYEYCAVYWARHAQETQVEGSKIVKFLDSDTQVQSSARALEMDDLTRDLTLARYFALGLCKPYIFEYLQGWTGLHLAAYLGLESSVKRLLDRHYSGLKPRGRRTRLLKHLDSSRLFHRGATKYDGEDTHPLTPFMLACIKGHKGVVQLFLAAPDVDIHCETNRGQKPLLQAAMWGHWPVVEMLLRAQKVKLHHSDLVGRTALSWAIRQRNEAAVKMLLDTARVNINQLDPRWDTPLWQAVNNGDESMVKLLLDTGKIDFSQRLPTNPTVLWCAAMKCNASIAKLLINAGATDASPSLPSMARSALWWAVYNGNAAIIKLLLDPRVTNPSQGKDRDEGSLSWWIAYRGNESIVKLFLDSGTIDTS